MTDSSNPSRQLLRQSRRAFGVLALGALTGCGGEEPTKMLRVDRASAALQTANSINWNSINWNSINWNSVAWNSINWNSINWNSINWNSIAWNALEYRGEALRYLTEEQRRELNSRLKANPNGRQFLQYLFSCAVPAAQPEKDYDSFLTAGGGGCVTTRDCRPEDSDHDSYYECSGTIEPGEHTGYALRERVVREVGRNACVLPLRGAIGLGINTKAPDGTPYPEAEQRGWWEGAACGESCQRWVSACILARTNAYGERVELSMRAHEDAPARIKAALSPSPSEERDFPLREGSYWGNLFAVTRASPPLGSQRIVPAPGAKPEAPPRRIAANETYLSSPTFNACAGPASSMETLTRRFGSSQGDRLVINVPGICYDVCERGPDDDGVLDDQDLVRPEKHCQGYDEVLTVYLREPQACCGNGVCEDREIRIPGGKAMQGAESAVEGEPNYCPEDCRPGVWAFEHDPKFYSFRADANDRLEPQQLDYPIEQRYSDGFAFRGGGLAVDRRDDSILVLGSSDSAVEVALGIDPKTGAPSKAPGLRPGAGAGRGILAKYTEAGALVWAVRFRPSKPKKETGTYSPHSVYVDQEGNVIALGTTRSGNETSIGIDTFDSSGRRVALEYPDPITGDSKLSLIGAAMDRAGELVLIGASSSKISFSDTRNRLDSLKLLRSANYYLAKISQSGAVRWASGLAQVDPPVGVTLDPQDDTVLFATARQTSTGTWGQLKKLSADGRSPIPLISSDFGLHTKLTAIEADRHGNVYIAGYHDGKFEVGGTFPGTSPYIVKFNKQPNGSLARGDSNALWAPSCPIDLPETEDIPECLPWQESTPDGATEKLAIRPVAISFDPQTDEAIITVWGSPLRAGEFTVAGRTLQMYDTTRVFLGAYTSGSWQSLRWFDSVPASFRTAVLGAGISSKGHLIIGGGFNTSVNFAGRLLVAPPPQRGSDVMAFLGSFPIPPTKDAEPPQLGCMNPKTRTRVRNVPSDLYAEATSRHGAEVSFALPLAFDVGTPTEDGLRYSGVHTQCTKTDPLTGQVTSAGPSRVFTLAPATQSNKGPTTTPVECTAIDAQGNQPNPKDRVRFNVTVMDTFGPLIYGVPQPMRVDATSLKGVVVKYPRPTAIDQVDGPRTVTCDPPPGSVFGPGKTLVNCKSSDTRGNVSQAQFEVTVRAMPGATPTPTAPTPTTPTTRKL